VPSLFIAGASGWGMFQSPGALERMRDEVCTRMLGCHLVEGAGHWVQQEQPQALTRLLLEFMRVPVSRVRGTRARPEAREVRDAPFPRDALPAGAGQGSGIEAGIIR